MSSETGKDPDAPEGWAELVEYHNELAKQVAFWSWCAGALTCNVPLHLHGGCFLAEPL
jgi:hypothetical protein